MKNEQLIKTNILMKNILWVLSIVFIVFVTASGLDKRTIYVCAPILFALSILCSVLIHFNIFTNYLQFIIALGGCIVHFLFVFFFHDLNGFFIGILILILVSLYQNNKTTIITSFFIILSVVYGYYTDVSTPIADYKMFSTFHNTKGLIIVILIFIIIDILIITQSMYVQKNSNQVKIEKENAEKSKLDIQHILNSLKQSLKTLIDFSQNLKQNVSITRENSLEANNSFKSISKSVDEQNKLILDINNSIVNETKHIATVSSETNTMKELSLKTLDIIDSANKYIITLEDEMNSVVSNVSIGVVQTSELTTLTGNIENILKTIYGISDQIDLLAINAKIESARAGEHGRGFSVVADEIGKLANNSSNSALEIKNILDSIKEKFNNISNQISLIEESTNTSKVSVNEVKNIFNDINSYSKDVSKKSLEVENSTSSIKTISLDIQDRIRQIKSFSENIKLSIEGSLEGSESQHEKVQELVNNFSTIENLIIQLKNFSNN